MPPQPPTSGLLAALLRLYRKILRRLLHRRLETPPQYTHVHDMHQTLLPLTDYLSRLSEQTEATFESENVNNSTLATATHRKAPPTVTKRLFKGLSSYFRRHRDTSTIQPELAIKMRDSTQQHINMALTHARRGNKESAHMQLGLANNALHMAEHYMSEEEFQSFHHELKAKLKSIEAEVGKL